MAIPLILLYEISLIFGKLGRRKKETSIEQVKENV
jgi:Sec-independent protein secretion pathway component TatC